MSAAIKWSEQEQRVRKARAFLMDNYVMFRRLIIRLKVIESSNVKTFETDGESLWFNPDRVDAATDPEVRGITLHETLHCALLHHTRMGSRRLKEWNEACDYAVNDIVMECAAKRPGEIALPSTALYNTEYRLLTAEEIYKILVKEADEQQQQQDEQQSGAGGDGEEGGDDSDTDSDPDDSDKGDAGDESDPDDADEADDQAADDDADAGDADASDEADQGNDGGKSSRSIDVGGTGSFKAPAAKTVEEMDDAASEWKNAMVQSIMGAGAGNLPAAMQREIQSIIAPRLDWISMLRQFMTARARDDYSWSAPNKRFVSRGMYLPSLRNEKLGWIAYVVDASGSIDREALNAGVSALVDIADSVGFEGVKVFVHEVGTSDTFTIEPGDDVIESMKRVRGGGGTRFAPTLADIAMDDEQFSAIIWFTDMDSPDLMQLRDAPAPVLWLVPHSPYFRYEGTPPFGEVVQMSKDLN